MCGIAGIYNTNKHSVQKPQLQRMCDIIQHRGPDDEGYFVQRNIGLCMRRLSIIDVAGGHQPMYSEDRTIWTVLNGEIYNFRELKRDLQSRGHVFATESDTEVIIHLYEEYGENFVDHLNGMFAIALWDRNLQKLLLVRDRVGIKPLYYAEGKGQFLFASELKAILAAGTIERDVDYEALDLYLTYGYIPAPYTIFKSVRKLMPGHILRHEQGSLSAKKYWDLQFHESPEMDEHEWVDRILKTLKKSVKRRLMSEVPLGAFLSGGIDSSLVVALMSEMSDKPVNTFSIGFDENEFNELPAARMTSKHFGTNHTEFVVQPNALDIIPKLARGFDEPFADSSAIPTYYVSQLAREHVTVALSGDGGDELFGGYYRYVGNPLHQYTDSLPSFVRQSVIGKMGERLPAGFRAKQFLTSAGYAKEERYFEWIDVFSDAAREGLYQQQTREHLNGFNSHALATSKMAATKSSSHITRFCYFDLKTYLPDDILKKVDMTSMMHSLEVRVPILDHELIELSAQIPPDLKINNGDKKYIFKQAARRILPENILTRKKQGFAVPLKSWFRHELKDLAYDTLLSKKHAERGLFKEDNIQHMLDSHVSGKEDNSSMIWSLLSLELWHGAWVDSSPGMAEKQLEPCNR